MQRSNLTTKQADSNTMPPASTKPSPLASTRALDTLRRALGNQAFGQAIQAKLTINRPGDEYEQEADRVADQVMRMPDDSTPAAVRSDGPPHISGLQRKCAQCEEEEIQRQPMNGTMDEEEEESPLQAKEVPGHSPQVTPAVQAQIDGLRGGGEPLPESARAFFEPRFGYDFSHVRTHTGAHAAESAKAVKALAFTAGPNVVFGSGRYEPNTLEGRKLLAHELTHVVQQTPFLSHKKPTIQRLPEEASSTAIPSRTMIVEDSVEELAPGQMKRSEFLAELQTAVCQTAEEALAGTGRSTEGCPYLDYWFGYYSGQDSQHIERAIHKYAPEASSVTTASEYISLIVARVRRSVDLWARTGEATGAPEGMPSAMPEGVPSAMPEAASTAGAEGSGAENGNILFKGREGGAKDAGNPQALQAQLGSGQPLDGVVNSRMSSAFGYDFSRVRVHNDASAAGLSASLNARAFTLGEHVAFGSDEYQPGTLIGDALIAHELAHVVQQGGESNSVAPKQMGDLQNDALEEDADKSAVGAMVSLLNGAKGALAEIAQNAMPRLRSGLRLSRCKGKAAEPKKEKEAEPKKEEKLEPQPTDIKSLDCALDHLKTECDGAAASCMSVQSDYCAKKYPGAEDVEQLHKNAVAGAESEKADIPNAAGNLLHFLDASGTEMVMPIELFKNHSATKDKLENEHRARFIDGAKKRLKDGRLKVGGSAVMVWTGTAQAFNLSKEDLGLAVGGYTLCSKVQVSAKDKGGGNVELTFDDWIVQAFDCYNWDPGKGIGGLFGGVSDKDLCCLQNAGKGKHFRIRTDSWKNDYAPSLAKETI